MSTKISDRDQRVRTLEAELQRARAILEGSVDFAIVGTDPDGRIVEWNVGAEHCFGWSAEEMLGQAADRFFTPEDRAADRPGTEMRLSLENGRAQDERWHLRKDGSRFRASGEMMPLRSESGEALGFVKIVRDRTAEYLAVQALREDEARLRRAQEAGGVGVFSIDLADDSLTPSPEFCRLYGLPIGGKHPTDGIAEQVAPEHRRRLSTPDQRRKGIVPAEVEYRITRADDGVTRWLSRSAEVERGADGRPLRVLGTVRDVTEARLAAGRRAALLKLTDRFPDLTDVDELTLAACAALGETLGVDLVGYGLVDPEAETITVEREWTAGSAESLVGTLSFRDYGIYIDDLKRGETVVVRDAREDPRTAAHAAALETKSARSFVNTPVFERGVFKAMLYVLSARPRAWSEDELQFIREVASRTRTATARIAAERDRRASEAELRLVADALPVLVAFVDRTLTYRFANAQYTHWFDVPPEEVVGRRIPELVGRSDYDKRRPYIEQALRGEAVRFDLPWPRPDGSRRIADIRYTPRRSADGQVDGFYVFVQDVTAQRDGEAMLTAERNRLWETTNDLMGRAGFDGYLKAVNPAWTALLGWSEAELLGRPFFDIVDPADHAETIDVVGRLTAGETVTGFVDRVLAREGAPRTVMWTAVPEPGTDFFYIVGRDITEQRQAEEALRQSQKMEAVGQLTGGLAHDFNNLLAGISGSLELMAVRMSQGRVADVEKYMTAAQGAARRAAALTHRLLAFSRRQTLDPKPTSVNRLVSGMTELIQRTVGPAIQVETVEASGLWPALVDPPQLENALLNLCINARDAMPDGGRITIETANKWLDRQAARRQDVPEGQYLSLCVTDTGTGMSPETIAKIFDPFFTTKPIGQGTGLGLSMIYGFAKQSGGQVRVYSELGQGTTMCIYLPRYLGEADAELADQGSPALATAQEGETVLVADDEPTVRMLVTDVLEDLGYTAIEAGDSAAGLKVLQSDARIDLLVTDVGLPGGMNGRQMADAGRESRPGLKVLFITGYAENAVLNNGHLSADMQVLTKPFAVEALATRIRELVDGQVR